MKVLVITVFRPEGDHQWNSQVPVSDPDCVISIFINNLYRGLE